MGNEKSFPAESSSQDNNDFSFWVSSLYLNGKTFTEAIFQKKNTLSPCITRWKRDKVVHCGVISRGKICLIQ